MARAPSAELRLPLAVAAGVVALLAVSVLVGPRPGGDPGATSAVPTTTTPDTTPGDAAPEPDPAPDPAPDAGPEAAPVDPQPDAPGPDPAPGDDAATAEPAPAPGRRTPLQVRIGAIAVDAPIVPVGLEPDGAMEIPDRVAEIGWYDPDGLGVVPGTTGTAVLAGHVDSRTQGRGALYDMRELRVGQTIELDMDDGSTQRWRITEVIQYPKVELPLNDIFTWAGPERLALITCGGEFDRTERSYTDNLVVYAEPLPASSA